MLHVKVLFWRDCVAHVRAGAVVLQQPAAQGLQEVRVLLGLAEEAQRQADAEVRVVHPGSRPVGSVDSFLVLQQKA